MKLKMYPTKNFQNSFKNLPSFITRAMMVVFLLASTHLFIYAQTLSLQGILKKANGIALEDGDYNITFKIYVVDSTQFKWMETIEGVEVISGIYSVILGANKMFPLNLAFDKDYELGISIGTQEMRPRVRLTSAPYALALRGSTNQFPSAGQVLADSILINGGIKVNNGVLAKQVIADSILVNNGIKVIGSVSSTGATIQGVLETNQVIINNNGGIKYSSTQGSFQDWRLVDVDDMESNSEEWRLYQTWNNGTGPIEPRRVTPIGPFLGNILQVTISNNQVFKKLFTIPGSWTHMKVKFKYFIIDTYGLGASDMAYAGFSSSALGSDLRVAWNAFPGYIQHTGNFNTTVAVNATNFTGTASTSDNWLNVEMTGRRNGILDNFWVFIGAALDQSVSDETFGIGDVEIWVR